MITSPPMSTPQRKTLAEARRETGGTRRSRVGRCWPFVGGEGGGWVLGERPPPGVRAIHRILRKFARARERVGYKYV